MTDPNLYDDNPFAGAISSLADVIENKVSDNLTSYDDNPVGFVEEVLQEKLWDGLKEIFCSIRDNRFTVVKSANSVGKTWSVARAVIWWQNVFPQYNKVITTAAPPERQIKELVWGEIRSCWRGAKDRGVPLVGRVPGVMSLRVNELWWAQGFTIPSSGTREERITRFQGHHSPHMLIVVDEAHGVPAEIFEAIDSCMSDIHNHLVLLSNPMASYGPFYEAFKDPKYHKITLSAFDHPNVREGRSIFPGCITREVTEDRIKKWSRPLQPTEDRDISCFDVPEYFNKAIAGTVRKVTMPMLDVKTLSRFPSQSTYALISIAAIEAAKARWTPVEPVQLPGIGGLDVAEFGVDSNAFGIRRGGWFSPITRWNGVDPIKTGKHATNLCKKAGIDDVKVDAIGVGSGVAPHMVELGIKNAVGVKVTESPTIKSKLVEGEFRRLRDQLLWSVREWLHTDPEAALPPDPQLIQELSVLTYNQDKTSGDLVVMSKDDIKELIGRSPDALDCLSLTFYVEKKWSEVKFIKV